MCASPNACIRGTEKPSEQELFARGGAVAVFMVLSFVVTPAARRGRDLTSSLRVRTTRLATRTMLVERAGRDDGVSRIPASAATTPEVRFAVPLAVGLTTRTRRSGSRGAGFRSISTAAYRTHPAAERQLPATRAGPRAEPRPGCSSPQWDQRSIGPYTSRVHSAVFGPGVLYFPRLVVMPPL